RGFEQAKAARTRLEAMMAKLDTLRRDLAGLDRRLQNVRDAATRHVLQRATEIVGRADDQLRWMMAMRHYHIDGPRPLRRLDVPPQYPSPASVLTVEENLTHAVAAAVESLAARAPGLIARSYVNAWRPGMIDRATAQGAEGTKVLAWARRVAASIDSNYVIATLPDSLQRLMAYAAKLAKTADSLTTAHQALRNRIARTALERSIAKLAVEREGIDYGLAASAYGISVGFDHSDTLAAAANPMDTTITVAEDTAATRWRGIAIQSLEQFLTAHPQSFARG